MPSTQPSLYELIFYVQYFVGFFGGMGLFGFLLLFWGVCFCLGFVVGVVGLGFLLPPGLCLGFLFLII